MRQRTRVYARRALWRVIRSIVPTIALLASLRAAWGLYGTHRLSAAREALQKLGLPAQLRDLPDPAAVPPAQNAAAIYLDALKDFKLDNDESLLVGMGNKAEGLDRVEFTADEVATLLRIARDHAALGEAVDAAGACALNVWPRDPGFYVGESSRSLADDRRVVQFFCVTSLLASREHRGADAFCALRRACMVSRITVQPQTLLSHLVSTACLHDVATTVERIDSDIAWKDPATAAEARLLIAELGRAEAVMSIANTCGGEAVWLDAMVSEIRTEPAWLIDPMLDYDLAASLRYYAVVAPAMRASTFPEFKSLPFPLPANATTRLDNLTRSLSDGGGYDPSRAVQLTFERVAIVRAARMLLAARLFEADQSRLPAVPAQLAPAYLADVPQDPFDPAGGSLRYRLEGNGVTIWSVGPDAIDHAAALAPPAGAYPSRRNLADIVYGRAWRDFLAANP
jgi:hypothetical protein